MSTTNVATVERRDPAVRLIASFDTVEDYSPVMEKLVTGAGFVSLENPTHRGNETISARGNHLVHYYRDPASVSGWRRHEEPFPNAPGGKPIQDLLAFYQDEDLYVVATFALGNDNYRAIGLKRSRDGRWTTNPFPEFAVHLESVRKVAVYLDAGRDGRKPRHILYGVSTSGEQGTIFAAYQDDPAGAWRLRFTHELPPGFYRGKQWTIVNAEAPNAFYWMRMEDETPGLPGPPRFFFQGCKWEGERLVFSGPDKQVNFNLSSFRSELARVFPIPASNGARGFFIQSINRELFYVYAYDKHVRYEELTRPTTPGEERPPACENFSLSVMRTNPARPCVCFVRSSKNLWILRQVRRGPEGEAVFGAWANLGPCAELLASPAESEALVVAVVNRASLVQMTQDPFSGSWRDSVMQAPIPSLTEFEKFTSHALTLKAVDARGNATPDVEMELYTRIPTDLVVNGRSMTASNSHPAVVRTDDAGRVTIRAKAWSLSAAPVEVHVAEFMPVGKRDAYSPDLKLCRRLAGKDTNFTVDEAVLKTRGLVPANIKPEHAGEVVKFIKRAGEGMLTSQRTALNFDPEADRASLGDCGWEFTFVNGTLGIRSLTEEEAKLNQFLSPSDLNDPAGPSDWFGDVVRFLKNTWDRVVQITVNFVSDVLHVSFKILDRLYQMAVRVASDIADTLVATLQKIGAAARDVGGAMLDWLQSLFGWDDIMNTKRVIRRCTDALFDAIIHSVDEDAQDLIVETFKKLRAQSAEQIRQIRAAIGGGGIRQLATRHELGNIEQPAVRNQFEDQSVRCEYVLNVISGAPGSKPPIQLSADDENELALFMKKIKELTDDPTLVEALKSFREDALKMMGTGDFSRLLECSFSALLDITNAVLQGALTFIEEVLRLVLRFISRMIKAIRSALEATWDIPVLSALYKTLANKPELGDKGLSLLEVAALAFAVPATILHKLANQGVAPFTLKQVEELYVAKVPFRGIADILRGAPAAEAQSTRIWNTILFGFDVGIVAGSILSGIATALGDGWKIFANDLAGPMGQIGFVFTIITRALTFPWLIKFFSTGESPRPFSDWIRLIINLLGWLTAAFSMIGILGEIGDLMLIANGLLGVAGMILGLILLVAVLTGPPGSNLKQAIAGSVVAIVTPMPSLARVFRPWAKNIPPVPPPSLAKKKLCTAFICGATVAGTLVSGGLRIFSGYEGAFAPSS